MAELVFTGTSVRAVANWLPALRALQARGHLVRSLLFPNSADPDHVELDDLGFESLGRIALPESLRKITPDAVRTIATAGRDTLMRQAPDGIVFTTCHAGPEVELAATLSADRARPVLIGCQHGFVQNWGGYWDRFCYDQFLVFGERFRRNAPAILRSRVHVAGLPKLDAVPRVDRPAFRDDHRPILFAAQTKCPAELVRVLAELAPLSGREVRVRPHPEFPRLFDGTGLAIAAPGEALIEQINASSLLVTTGSTAVLEAMVAGCPAVVLPLERGDEYREAGIVTDSLSATGVMAVAAGQAEHGLKQRVAAFLSDSIGSADSSATARTVGLIESFLSLQDAE